MAKYFPKNRVIDNKYTNGDKFVTAGDKKPYVGYYYETYKIKNWKKSNGWPFRIIITN